MSSVRMPQDRTSLNRRHILQGGLAALCLPAAVAHATPADCPVVPAARFADSVAVCTHLSSEPYASRYARFRKLIGDSGIRTLRDEVRATNDLSRWVDLHRTFGIRSHMLVSPSTNTIEEMLTYVKALGVERIAAIEGQNEGDSEWFMATEAARGDWSGTTIRYQREAYQALRRLYDAATLPIVSPSVLDWKPDDAKLLRPAAAFCDIVAIHSYVQSGQEPETGDDYAALSWYLRNMRDGFKPGAPVMTTEAGYTNITRKKGGGVSEAAAATYLPRLLLNNFSAGILRTFLYEFMDGGTDAGDSEHHWGLVHNDGSPKPSYHAIRMLLQALRGGAAERPKAAGWAVGLADPAEDARCLGFVRPDGSLILAVWRAVRCWDPTTMRDVTPLLRVLGVRAGGAARASFQELSAGSRWTEVPVVKDRLDVPVAARAVLVRLER